MSIDIATMVMAGACLWVHGCIFGQWNLKRIQKKYKNG